MRDIMTANCYTCKICGGPDIKFKLAASKKIKIKSNQIKPNQTKPNKTRQTIKKINAEMLTRIMKAQKNADITK